MQLHVLAPLVVSRQETIDEEDWHACRKTRHRDGRRSGLVSAVVVATAIGVGGDQLNVEDTGYQEVPSLSTPARATFTAEVASDESSIAWTLSYTDIQSGPAGPSPLWPEGG